MNTIGIDHNLDRARIRKLLTIGLFASVLTGIGDFLLGYGESTAGGSFAASVMASAPNLAYKYLLQTDEALAAKAADQLFFGFSLPIYLLLVIFWLPMMIIQFKAFAKGLTPYPRKAKWFCVPIGAVPSLLLTVILGPNTALGAGIGTMFLSFGNAFMFGGLKATMPSAEQFTTFESPLRQSSEG